MTDVHSLTASAGGTFADFEVKTGGVCRPDTDEELWFYFDEIPEARWFSLFTGRSMRNVHLQAGRQKQGEAEPTPVGKMAHTEHEAEGSVADDEGTQPGIDTEGEMVYANATDERAAELVAEIDGPYGVSGLMELCTQLLGVIGHCYWVGFVEEVPLTVDGELIEPGAAVPGGAVLEKPVIVEHGVFSTEEVKRDHQRKVWLQWKAQPGGGGDWEDMHKSTLVIPIRDSHPRRSTISKSAYRAARSTLRRVCQLQAAQTAIANSRLATRGLLLIAQEWDIPMPDWWVEEGNKAEDWNMSTWLHRAILAPLANPGTSASAAPLVAAVPYEFLEKGIKLVDFYTDFDKHLIEQIAHELKRVAIAWDVPTSLMTTDGVENMNHWNIWAVQESTDTTTWRPLAKLITAPLTKWYLQKTLRDEGFTDWAEMSIIGDTSNIMAKANRTEEALKLFDKQLLSAKETVIESGFDPEQMPSDAEELANWLRGLARNTADGATIQMIMALLGIDLEKLRDSGALQIDGEDSDGVSDEDDEAVENAEQDGTGDAPDTGPDGITASAADLSGLSDVDALRDQLVVVGMAESTAFEAVRRAGNVLRQNIADKAVRAEVDRLEAWQIPGLLGIDEVDVITANLEATKSIEHGVWAPQSFLRLHAMAEKLWSTSEADVFVSWVRAQCEERMFEDLSEGSVLNPREVMARLPRVSAMV